MYISKFSAFNYRSLRQLSIRLEDGKNVIVGKNNSGKSNIIRGIEILVGEKFPIYQNISDNDFYTYEKVDEATGEIVENISDNFYLEVELSGRDFNEDSIKSIKKGTAFSKVKATSVMYTLNSESEVEVNFEFFQGLEELEEKEGIVSVDTQYGEKKTTYRSAPQLLEFLKGCKHIKLFFCKSRIEEEKAGYGLICYDVSGDIWISHFLSKKLRDSLITTTVISALRSQKEDLRLAHYTWFGKLILGLWNKNKIKLDAISNNSFEHEIKNRSLDIKNLVDQVFASDTMIIRELLQGAIAHKAVSFKFLEDANDGLHKNVRMFINDGIDRPLHEKGTGIQSAIIISLFSLYCDQYHKSSSLLIAEEPELYLHPQARRVISAELDKFLQSSLIQKRQLIISTHSTEFLRNVEPYNIIRVFKDPTKNCSISRQLDKEVSKLLTDELKRFMWSNNSELFFADKVVLVEGGEVYLVPSIVDAIKNSNQVLDYKNITVTRVNGKGSFLTYIKILDCFDIPYLVLGDLDCFKDEVGKISNYKQLTHLEGSISKVKKAICQLPTDFNKLSKRLKDANKNFDAQQFQIFLERFEAGRIASDDPELIDLITSLKARNASGNKHEAIINSIGVKDYDKIHSLLRDNNIFIWKCGDLETCYSENVRTLITSTSKDIVALQLSYKLKVDKAQLDYLFTNVEEMELLVANILDESIDGAINL